MGVAIVLALLAAVLLGPAGALLDRLQWIERVPKTGVLLWQALGLAGALSAIGAGLAVGVVRYHAGFFPGVSELAHDILRGRILTGLGVPEAVGLTLAVDAAIVLVSVMTVTTIRVVRTRARHRHLLDLVALDSRYGHGTVTLEDARATAYYIPGLRPRIVVSTGAVQILNDDEVAAVLAHERGHAQERHGLVLLPLSAAGEVLRWVPYMRRAPKAVASLLEFAADDYAARHASRRLLASALIRMATALAPPPCAFGVAPALVPRRVERLLHTVNRSRHLATLGCGLAGLLVALPIVIALAA
jgi:Zn-dependent protease with chaperone function